MSDGDVPHKTLGPAVHTAEQKHRHKHAHPSQEPGSSSILALTYKPVEHSIPFAEALHLAVLPWKSSIRMSHLITALFKINKHFYCFCICNRASSVLHPSSCMPLSAICQGAPGSSCPVLSWATQSGRNYLCFFSFPLLCKGVFWIFPLTPYIWVCRDCLLPQKCSAFMRSGGRNSKTKKIGQRNWRW